MNLATKLALLTQAGGLAPHLEDAFRAALDRKPASGYRIHCGRAVPVKSDGDVARLERARARQARRKTNRETPDNTP